MRRTPHGGSGTGWITEAELLKLQKNGHLPDESVKIKDTQIHNGCKRPDVLAIADIKEITLSGMIIVVSAVLAYFVSGSLNI